MKIPRDEGAEMIHFTVCNVDIGDFAKIGPARSFLRRCRRGTLQSACRHGWRAAHPTRGSRRKALMACRAVAREAKAGGESVSQSTLKNKRFLTFLDQNPPFELPPENGVRLHEHVQFATARFCSAQGNITGSKRSFPLRSKGTAAATGNSAGWSERARHTAVRRCDFQSLCCADFKRGFTLRALRSGR
jgi:hypothetical protein